MKPFSISLNKAKSSAAAPPPALKKSAAFGSLDDDEPIDAAPTASSSDRNVSANKKFLAQNALNSKAMQKRMEKELKVDETVYDYDGVWDKMQEAKQRQKEIKDTASKDKKPKYMGNLLASAATRRLDHLRAEEKMMQLEREREGDEFADKEAFVTQAYKDQMAEVRKAEEEEKQREEQQKKKSGSSTGLAVFYRKLLEESEQVHQAAVDATQKPIIGPQGPAPNLIITKPPDFTPVSDLELAKIARAEGKEVELNDDNQIVDKRELLSAGLNLSGINTRNLTRSTASNSNANTDSAPTHRAAGTAASRREINQRRQHEIEQQMEAEQVRSEREKEQAEQEAAKRVITKRNNEDDIQSARERYLQRKRQKLDAQLAGSTGE